MAPVGGIQPQPAVQVVMTQPSPVVITTQCLTNIPGLVKCHYCNTTVTTKVRHTPGTSAWCMCVVIALMG